MPNHPFKFSNIRQWRGSQDQAFEELCYQLRDPTPDNAELVKTGNPDGGLEWYVTLSNGVQWGWQAKFIFKIDMLLQHMKKSLETVVQKRPKCRRLTFCIPFDLPDAPGVNERKSARQKYKDAKERWRERIPGADRVRIELWSEGDLLQRLVRNPAHRGISWFFWDEEVFSPEWCKQRHLKAVNSAGPRYSPELHIDLPVSFAFEGLAQTEDFWERYRARRNAVLTATDDINVSGYTGIGVTGELRTLVQCLKEWRFKVPERVGLPTRLDRNLLVDLTITCLKSANDAFPQDRPRPKRSAATKKQIHNNERRNRLKRYLHDLLAALQDFDDLLLSNAAKAADAGLILLSGEAGQGKTHLYCDVSRRAIENDQPAILIFGGRMSGRHVWSEVAEQLGLEQVGSEYLLGAMQAAAEASNSPFLLLIDALNEAADPHAWREELPALLSEVDQNPWISVGISVRSSYRRIVLPDSGLTDVAEIEHTGFREREIEASEVFFSAFELELPRTPRLEPEFTNPLFLKLYCESLKGLGLSAPQVGGAHMSEVFDWYLECKESQIVSRLKLDPASRPVKAAINAFSEALAKDNRDYLARDRCEQIINGIAPQLYEWPNTLFGQLLSEDVLTKDVTWKGEEAVRFTYQRFSDYRVVSTLLKPYNRDQIRLRQALKPRNRLRNRVLKVPPGWIEALSVQLPERFNIELLDAARWHLRSYTRYQWDEAFVQSISVRRPSAVTERTREVLSQVHRRSGLNELVLETVLTVAPQPEHLLNAKALHRWLKRLPMPTRDVVWSIPTYFEFNRGGALDRLIRWSARGPYPDCPDEAVELAAIPLIWTFTSPNRRMRDYVTKCLSSLLSERLSVLPALIRKFDGCNDPYVVERLAVVSHGAVLSGGICNPQAAVSIAVGLKKVAFAEDQIPNIITRDAVRGVYEWCIQHGLIDDAQYTSVQPPYGSAPPKTPRTKEQLERQYDQQRYVGVTARWPYSRVFNSVFSDDFSCYVIDSKLRNFSHVSLSSVRRNHGIEEWYPVMQAKCWVFERVLSLGWKPELFSDFDRDYVGHQAGRSEHKIERFGKKYQWMALQELIARVADNFQMTENIDYQGPWQFFSRDVDPTLPPPSLERIEDDSFRLHSTFSPTKADLWSPPGPSYRHNDPVAGEDWGTNTDDVPGFETLIRNKDEDGIHWVVLHAHYNWDEEIPEGKHWWSQRHRSFWSHIYSWLVHPADQPKLTRNLNRHSLKGRWMPVGLEHADAAYLGELPWAKAANSHSTTSDRIRWPHHPIQLKHDVHPTWIEYLWEGNVLDCSINDGVHAWLPTPILCTQAKLRWRPGTREWVTPNGTTVVQHCERERHMVLLVRESWLKRTIRQTGHSIVFGWLGEKKLLEAGFSTGLVGDWTEINGIATLVENQWDFGKPRLERHIVNRQVDSYDTIQPADHTSA